jgi:tryptophanyl-tRNA synthetase
MSAELSERLASMNLPQPERIFGPDEGNAAIKKGDGKGPGQGQGRKEGVSAEDWDAVTLDDEVPEAVKAPERMTHSRNASRA